ncbi:MAG: hypothetical protein IKF19_01625 [Bacilli bacterium]|nr:hypothetical protein [Bacilli bacterium]
MTKITKKNSILYNQLWINKVIEDGLYNLIPIYKNKGKSIGEYIEERYNNITKNNSIKITKKNSLLYESEWIAKYKEENLPLPSRTIQRQTNYSYGEILDLKYFERQLLKNKTKRLLLLPGETINR